MELSVCAVVVTYNRKEKLRKCLYCIKKQKIINCDIVIINNASTDGTEEMILREFSDDRIHYYNTGVNLGGSGGFEFGIREALLLEYEYIWIMDDDTWPNDTALSELFVVGDQLENKWGFLSSVAYWTDGSICKANVQKKSLFTFAQKDDYNRLFQKIQFASFVSLLVKSSIVRELGLPLGAYFIWTDDYEYTGRISKKYKGYMVPSSTVIHAMDVHKKANIAKDDIGRIERYSFLFRNDVHCYLQYGIKGWFYLFLKDIYMIFNILIFSDNKKLRLKVIMDGVRRGFGFRPQIKYIDDL